MTFHFESLQELQMFTSGYSNSTLKIVDIVRP